MRNEENICRYCTRQHAITTLSLNTYWNQMYQELCYLLTNCIELALYSLTLTKTETRSKTASTVFLNIWQLYIFAFQYEYFVLSSFVSYSIFCCNQFVFECFVPNIRLLLKTHTYYVVGFTVLTYFAWNLDLVKLSQ